MSKHIKRNILKEISKMYTNLNSFVKQLFKYYAKLQILNEIIYTSIYQKTFDEKNSKKTTHDKNYMPLRTRG